MSTQTWSVGELARATGLTVRALHHSGGRRNTLHGIGPSAAARLIGNMGDVSRFTNRAHSASWNGTAANQARPGWPLR